MLNHLFQPVKIGALQLSNKVIMGSMHVGLEAEAQGETALSTFYTVRGKMGGPALMITGGISVAPEGEGGSNFLGFYRRKDCDAMENITIAVHKAGGKIAAQLFHAGRYAYSDLTGRLSVAPSALRSSIHRDTPKALSEEEIERLISAYADSAVQAKILGFDAIEIMGSEGYLINQFVSPVTNRRTDKFGGSFENRLRFPLEVLDAIRERVGADYPVIFRMSGTDLMPGSTTREETVKWAKALEEHGADAINIGIGWHESQVPTISTLVPRAGFIHIAREIKNNIDIPVIGSNRINDPKLADALLEKGDCDIISMARPFLADPDLLQKAASGNFDAINTCVACNQACLDHAFEGKPASCLVNPLTGREHLWTFKKESRPQKVAVIGAGVAGLEAARALAESGDEVILYEATSEIGGHLRLAKEVPGKQEFNETLRYYTHELDRLGVQIFFESSPTPDRLIDEKIDHVVVATGVRSRVPDISGLDHPNVVFYHEILDGSVQAGKNVAIIGAGGIGCDTAHFLVSHGNHNIVMLRRKGKIGQGLGKTTRWALIKHLMDNGVSYQSNLTYEKIDDDGLTIRLTNENMEESILIKADTIIIAAGQESVHWPVEELKRTGIKVSVIGGAKLAGELDAKRAIYEAATLAYKNSSSFAQV